MELPAWLAATFNSISSSDNPLVITLGVRTFSGILATNPQYSMWLSQGAHVLICLADLSSALWAALTGGQQYKFEKHGPGITLYRVAEKEDFEWEDAPQSEQAIRQRRRAARDITTSMYFSPSSSLLSLSSANLDFSPVQSIAFVVIKHLWTLFHPSLSVVHYTAARLFLELKQVVPDDFDALISYALRKDTLKVSMSFTIHTYIVVQVKGIKKVCLDLEVGWRNRRRSPTSLLYTVRVK